MRREMVLLFLLVFPFQAILAQYPPQAGLSGTTAVPRHSPRFTGWADRAQLERGWLNIADKSLGKVSAGEGSLALGPADFQVVSLGDSGVITLEFDAPLYNGPGPDFAVFENGFRDPLDSTRAFLEFAFVEVSDNGRDFYRFPAAYRGDTLTQVAGAGEFLDARHVHNLAGKYIGGYGTPFDLEELDSFSGLNIQHITHIRLVDVIGSLGAQGSRDAQGRKINDPYPTDFPVGGFDLDAVGAFYQQGRFPSGLPAVTGNQRPYRLYPNPCAGLLFLEGEPGADWLVEGIDPLNRSLGPIPLTALGSGRYQLDLGAGVPGIYHILIRLQSGEQWTEKIIYTSMP